MFGVDLAVFEADLGVGCWLVAFDIESFLFVDEMLVAGIVLDLVLLLALLLSALLSDGVAAADAGIFGVFSIEFKKSMLEVFLWFM